MANKDSFQKYLDAGIAFTTLTRARAEELVSELVQSGEFRGDARAKVDELIERSRKSQEAMFAQVRQEVDRQLEHLGITNLEDLAKQVASLIGRTTEAGRAAAGGRGPAGKKAARNSPAKKSTAKKATAKKATAKKATAKKATAKKSPAKKATAKKATAKKATAKKATAKKATAKKATAKKSTAKKATAKRSAATKRSSSGTAG